MGRRLSFLAILAICVTGTFSIPQEADPIPIDPEYPEEPLDCEWGVWGPCGATCGIGRQVHYDPLMMSQKVASRKHTCVLPKKVACLV